MDTEKERSEMTLTVRDSINGNKLYEIIRLNGEAEVFDYITTSRHKVDASELFDWLRENGIGLEGDNEQGAIVYRL